jgi:hypothetical protein
MAEAPIKIEDMQAQSSQDEFWALRGKSIAAYASIENSLCTLLSLFGNMELHVASTIFYKLSDTRKIGLILTSLIKSKYGETYRVFWNSLGDTIRRLTNTRNKIVHWAVSVGINQGYAGTFLRPPDMHDFERFMSESLGNDAMKQFIEECGFISRLCNMFFMFNTLSIGSHWSEEQQKTWRDIFSQPIQYPRPSNHPLLPMPPVPEPLLPASPASPQPPPTQD